jgi:hypothetical protein
MKKFIVLLIILIILGGGAYYLFFYHSNPTDPDFSRDPDERVITKTPDESEIVIIDEQAETDDSNNDEEIIEDSSITKRVVPNTPPLQSYAGHFIKFSYHSTQQVIEDSLSSLKLVNGETQEIVAVFDILTNEKNLSIQEFLAEQDSIPHYFKEADDNNIEAQDIKIPTAKEGVKFADMPGFVVQDVYLVSIGDYIVILSAWADKEFVAQTVAMSLELAQ